MAFILAAAAGMGIAALVSLALPRAFRDRFFAAVMLTSGMVGAGSAIGALLAGQSEIYEARWLLPIGRLALRLDMLSALFLVPVFLVPSLAAVFGAGYWRESEHRSSATLLRIFLGLLPAAMTGVLLAQNGVVLLIAWEIMAVSAFFAIAAEDAKREVQSAAWVYLVATHLGTLSLIGFFTLLASMTGSADLTPLPAGIGTSRQLTWLFVLGLAGFGLKAGTMPLHVWLPGAHANAPSHVSAVLSAVMLKIGVYGLVRMCWMLPPGPMWMSWLLIGLGGVSALGGILFALGQRDYKRLLAYSSIENIGIIVMGLGLALLGKTTGSPVLTTLSLAGALLHVWNHALFKSLLFLVSGAMLHATDTRRLNALGGLARRMPRTAAVAAIACIAISALPPLNGFISEWLLYRSAIGDLARSRAGLDVPLAAAVVAIASTGALALMAFVRFFGTAFLGVARSAVTAEAHDPPASMLVPMWTLAALCFAIALLPQVFLVPVGRAVLEWAGPAAFDAGILRAVTSELWMLSAIGVGTLALVFVLVRALSTRAPAPFAIAKGPRGPATGTGTRTGAATGTETGTATGTATVHATEHRPGTWDCGYLRPSARMQYTESSLAQSLVGLARGILWPRRRRPDVSGPFPAVSAFESETPDVVLDRGILPALELAGGWILRLRQLQKGRVQVHLLYVLLGLLLLLVFA